MEDFFQFSNPDLRLCEPLHESEAIRQVLDRLFKIAKNPTMNRDMYSDSKLCWSVLGLLIPMLDVITSYQTPEIYKSGQDFIQQLQEALKKAAEGDTNALEEIHQKAVGYWKNKEQRESTTH